MIEVLKEMGIVCRNKEIGEQMVETYRRRFNSIYKMYPMKAEEYRKEFMWWNKKVIDMKIHLRQLHTRLKKAS